VGLHGYVKRRANPAPGSIPAALDIFRAEVRFYREIAPVAGVRVPACYQAEITEHGTMLVLEDLSGWEPGADRLAAARLLADMHRRWSGAAHVRWPWLRPAGAGARLVEELFSQVQPALAARPDVTPRVRALAQRLAGRVVQSEQAIILAGPITLVHGDASAANMRTGPSAEVALLDRGDVSGAPGVLDLGWLLVSSVQPAQWDDVIAAYGSPDGLPDVLAAVAVQGLLSLADTATGSAAALDWVTRLDAAAARLGLSEPRR
jgi:aminoglycoside phosphotransferase (APT) family kinase protein